MRILQLHTRYRQTGGEDGVADAEAHLLRQGGHDVITVRRQNSSTARGAGGQLLTYPWNPVSDRRLMRLVDRIGPDVVHFHNTWFATPPGVLPALRRQGVPTVATIHNYRLSCVNAELLRQGRPCELCVGKVPWRGIRYRCYHGSTGRSAAAAIGITAHRALGTWRNGVDRFIALTDFSRERLVAGGLPADRTVIRPNFVTDPGTRPARPGSSRQVLFAGRLSREKGLEVALEAWSRNPPPGLQLVVAGDGPQRGELERIGAPGVRFLGRVPREEVAALLLGSRASLAPSIWFESQPLSVLESFAAETAVLGSAIGGLGETIDPLGPDWRVVAGDVDAWARALARLVDNAFVDRGGTAARAAFELKHTPAHAREMLEQTYVEASNPADPDTSS